MDWTSQYWRKNAEKNEGKCDEMHAFQRQCDREARECI